MRVRSYEFLQIKKIAATTGEKNLHVQECNREAIRVQEVLAKDLMEVTCCQNLGTICPTIQKVFEDTAKETRPI